MPEERLSNRAFGAARSKAESEHQPTKTAPDRLASTTDQQQNYDDYIHGLIHSWSKTLTMLASTLVPIFFVLDICMLPPELLMRFGLYRLVATLLVIAQFFVIRQTKPGRLSILHGYFISTVVGGSIALMTTDLGGFNSTYYAGLNLVNVAIAILLPWAMFHSASNTLIVIGLYVALNLIFPSPQPLDKGILINNLCFLLGTAVIAVSINYVKQRLIRQEFFLRTDLKTARDALWGEMEVAKRIQTSLLPRKLKLEGYNAAAVMLPAEEVGGDYYDIIQTTAGETWISIGDVSGHGVESGLIMMMTQTSIFTTVNRDKNLRPSEVLNLVNTVIRENISRMGADRYMTLTTMVLEQGRLIVAGKHQDILVYRAAEGATQAIPTTGTWLGIVDDLGGFLQDLTIEINRGDVVLLYTDGVTEAMDNNGEMYGDKRLERALTSYASLEVEETVKKIVAEIREHTHEQQDDITVIAIKRG